jgi:NADP-dependent 3-hydroxy acid dehydrogenase YdfG
MKINLTGKVAFITGASSGIGRAAAILLSQLGADVGLFARNGNELTTLKDEINYAGKGKALALQGDVSKL